MNMKFDLDAMVHGRRCRWSNGEWSMVDVGVVASPYSRLFLFPLILMLDMAGDRKIRRETEGYGGKIGVASKPLKTNQSKSQISHHHLSLHLYLASMVGTHPISNCYE